MRREFSELNLAFILCALVLATMLLSGCVASTRLTPTAISSPTPEIVVSATAKQVESSVAATLIASALFDIPEDKYLLVRAIETENLCMYNCKCAASRPDNWNKLGASRRQQMMQDMIQGGARGFIHVVSATQIDRCMCSTYSEWREPIKRLPFTLGDVTLYRAERDGTVIARAGNATYSFKPGDKWSYTNSVQVTWRSIECEGSWHIQTLSFQNDGLIDKSQLLGD